MFSDADGVSKDYQKMIKNGSCINPETAFVQGTETFDEQLAFSGALLNEESSEWNIIMFYSYQFFDTQDPVKPIKTRVAWLDLDFNTDYFFELTLHKLELSDAIFSPFKSSENRSYLSLKEKHKEEYLNGERTIDFSLSNNIVIEKRTRYTIWDLLGDVGGFNDGLTLVCQLLTSVYTAVSFKTQFLT